MRRLAWKVSLCSLERWSPSRRRAALLDAHHELACVFSAEQHAEPDRRLLEAFEHVQPLDEAPFAQPRREPAARFVVAVAIVEDEKALHASMHGGKPPEIADAIRFRRQ